jgi:hypothetical protein
MAAMGKWLLETMKEEEFHDQVMPQRHISVNKVLLISLRLNSESNANLMFSAHKEGRNSKGFQRLISSSVMLTFCCCHVVLNNQLTFI